jgi:hypothetical protein
MVAINQSFDGDLYTAHLGVTEPGMNESKTELEQGVAYEFIHRVMDGLRCIRQYCTLGVFSFSYCADKERGRAASNHIE